MEDFEISIKSRPGGSTVTVKGSATEIPVEFAMLAASVNKHTGLPLGILATAVANADKLYREAVEQSVTIDRLRAEEQLLGGAR